MQYKQDYYKNLRIIDKAIEGDKLDPKVFELIKQDSYQDYFFNSVSSKIWFPELEERGYFQPQNQKQPRHCLA